MKQTILILTFILCTGESFADCMDNGISFWPSGQTIMQNSLIVIDGFATSQKVIMGLNEKYPIYLKSGDKKIELIVKEILVGEFRLTQAVLTFDETLQAGQDYELFIDNLPESERALRKWNVKKRVYEKVTWTAVAGVDTDKPIWKAGPVETKKTLIYFGCGPETFVHFKFTIADASEFLIRTTVTNPKTNKKTAYYLEPDGSTLKVGHGMCSGAFLLEEGDDFEVTFDIMDASGNLARWPGKEIYFTKPNDENRGFD